MFWTGGAHTPIMSRMKLKKPIVVSKSGSVRQDRYLVLCISLDEITPSIWRRLVVPASITLDLLHDVFQVVMGWEDYHLHEFTIGGRRFTEDPEEPDEGIEEAGLVLGDFITNAKSKFNYGYDFGDGWEHTVTVEKMANIPEGHAVDITCLDGKRRCPPEDVGGPPGYANYLEALADPKHEDHKDMLRWRGEFDPKAFDPDRVNRELAKLVRWSRHRKY